MKCRRFWEELSRDGVVGAAAVVLAAMIWRWSRAEVAGFWTGWMCLSILILAFRELRRKRRDNHPDNAE
jgi:hypothetical protein